MRDASFYLTMAQVFPTLLIAVVLELRTAINKAVDEFGLRMIEFTDHQIGPKYFKMYKAGRIVRNLVAVYAITVLAFVIHESASLAAALAGLCGDVSL